MERGGLEGTRVGNCEEAWNWAKNRGGVAPKHDRLGSAYKLILAAH